MGVIRAMTKFPIQKVEVESATATPVSTRMRWYSTLFYCVSCIMYCTYISCITTITDWPLTSRGKSKGGSKKKKSGFQQCSKLNVRAVIKVCIWCWPYNIIMLGIMYPPLVHCSFYKEQLIVKAGSQYDAPSSFLSHFIVWILPTSVYYCGEC